MARALRKQADDLVPEFDLSIARAFQPCRSPIDRVRLVSDTLHGRCTSHAALGGTNSCVVVHGLSHVGRTRTRIHVRDGNACAGVVVVVLVVVVVWCRVGGGEGRRRGGGHMCNVVIFKQRF